MRYVLRLLVSRNPIRCVRFRHSRKEIKVEKPVKVSQDVVNYLESCPELREIKDLVPKHLLRKYKSPESMYLISRTTAEAIANTLKQQLDADSPIIEVNPGFCFLSEEIIKNHKSHIYMYESSHNFLQFKSALEIKYPSHFTYKVADFFGMWKLVFQDKMDQGNRMQDLLGNLYTEDKNRVVNIVGAMPSLAYVRHLIYTIILHKAMNQLGRSNMYMVIPGHHYEFLADARIKSTRYRQLPALFQLLFDYKILSKVPKVHFLPWTSSSDTKKMDDYCLYLVNIKQKEKLPCSSDCLPLLWYFFKTQNIAESKRVIPSLDQWIPGSGVRLITGLDPPDTRRHLGPTEEDAKLPPLMTISTTFGQLNLGQKLTIFKRFISWPEFEQCQFRVTMENNLPRSVSQMDHDDDEDKETVVHIDDVEPSDDELETMR